MQKMSEKQLVNEKKSYAFQGSSMLARLAVAVAIFLLKGLNGKFGYSTTGRRRVYEYRSVTVLRVNVCPNNVEQRGPLLHGCCQQASP